MRLEVLWRQTAGVGAEHLMLNMDGEIHADGLAVGEVDGSAYRIHYRLDLDPGWSLQQMRVENLLDGQVVELAAAGEGSWQDGEGKPLANLAANTWT